MPVIGNAGPGKYTVYAVSWDGRLWQLNAADGAEVAPPEKFVPPNGKPYALNLQKDVVYTSTAQGCGGVTHMFLGIRSEDASVRPRFSPREAACGAVEA